MGSVAIFKGKLVKFLAKSGILVPKRTTADRSVTPDQGETAFNTTDSKLEVFDGVKWVQLSGGTTVVTVTQATHGFVVGDVLYLNSSTYAKAIATAANTAEVVGMVSRVVSANIFELTICGEVTGLAGLTTGEVYFLSASAAGGITITEPTTVGQISLPIGVASSATALYVRPSRGVVIGAANARTTITVINSGATSVVDITNYNSLSLEGELNVTRSSGGNQRAYYTVEATKNGAGTWQVAASYTGDDILYTTLPAWDVSGSNLQITMPTVTNFTSASLTYSLNAPAVGVSLPLTIDSTALNIVDTAPLSYRNKIINGDMRIDQRGAGGAFTVNAATNVYTLDRWQGYGQATDGVFTIQRVTDVPSGFNNSLKVTVTTADASISASQIYFVSQRIEGYNVADLELGKSTAKTFTVSFWAKSSIAATYSVSFGNNIDRSYPTTYTINSANTWEYKTITIPGVTDGTWNYENGVGLIVHFDLGSGASVRGTANTWANYPYGVTGSASLISTNGATLQITGVQLEVGSKASPFERRPYGMELQLCQRYYLLDTNGGAYSWFAQGQNASTTTATVCRQFPVPMRTTPSAIDVKPAAGNFLLDFPAAAVTVSTIVLSSANSSTTIARIAVTAAGLTTGQPCGLAADNAAANTRSLGYSAEL
jgi:hypothetical protein